MGKPKRDGVTGEPTQGWDHQGTCGSPEAGAECGWMARPHCSSLGGVWRTGDEKPPRDMVWVRARPWQRLMHLRKGEASLCCCPPHPACARPPPWSGPGQPCAVWVAAELSRGFVPGSGSASGGGSGERAPTALCLSSQVKVTLASRLKKING